MMPEPVAGCEKMHHLRLSSITLDLRNSQQTSSYHSIHCRDYFKGPCKDPVTNPEWYLIAKEQSLVSPGMNEKKESGMSDSCGAQDAAQLRGIKQGPSRG